jgi:argininosuccinate synthase
MANKLLANRIHMAYVDAVNEIRSRLGAANVSGFYLSITAEGRTMTEKSEVKIEYNLGTGRYDGATVKGNDLERCIVELLRRHGWDETNKPLALAAPSRPCTVVKVVNDDEDY